MFYLKKLANQNGVAPVVLFLVTIIVLSGVFVGAKLVQSPTNFFPEAKGNKDSQVKVLHLYFNQSIPDYAAHSAAIEDGSDREGYELCCQEEDKEGQGARRRGAFLGFVLKDSDQKKRAMVQLYNCRNINDPKESHTVAYRDGVGCDESETQHFLGYAYTKDQLNTKKIYFCKLEGEEFVDLFLGDRGCKGTGGVVDDSQDPIWVLKTPKTPEQIMAERKARRAAELAKQQGFLGNTAGAISQAIQRLSGGGGDDDDGQSAWEEDRDKWVSSHGYKSHDDAQAKMGIKAEQLNDLIEDDEYDKLEELHENADDDPNTNVDPNTSFD